MGTKPTSDLEANSGRKYKHCCLRAADAADFRWRQIRAAEGRLVPELLELSVKECGQELVAAALEEFFLWDGAATTSIVMSEAISPASQGQTTAGHEVSG